MADDAQAGWRRRLLVEAALVTLLWIGYNLGRLVAAGHTSPAFSNSDLVWKFERFMLLPNEQWIQQAALETWRTGVELLNLYYTTVHFPLTLIFLIALFVWRPLAYVWARRSLVLLTGAALLVHLGFPLAPPRMRADLGFVDVGQRFGVSPYSEVPTDSVSNQFAAMPSMHVGWSVLVAIVLVSILQSRWRWLWVAHPILTVAAVTVTGHHYFLDGIVACVLLVPALVLARRGLPAIALRAKRDRQEAEDARIAARETAARVARDRVARDRVARDRAAAAWVAPASPLAARWSPGPPSSPDAAPAPREDATARVLGSREGSDHSTAGRAARTPAGCGVSGCGGEAPEG